VFILDEMITGFRWHVQGHNYGIEPDLCTFGKAMANGLLLQPLAGEKRNYADWWNTEGAKRVFLTSTTVQK
jgi:glutamate-1-semialdehyde 2,1-aminomutase